MKTHKFVKTLLLIVGITFLVSCEEELIVESKDNYINYDKIMIWKNGINHLKLNHPNAKEEISKNSIKLEVIVVGCIHQRIK